MRIRTQTLLVAVSGVLGATAVQAQAHRCIVGGTTYISDRPCAPTNPSPARMVGAGALQPQVGTAYRASIPNMPAAPEHQRYLSPRCAEVSDAIRTAPSRGVGRSTVMDLQREYRRQCADDEAYAQERVSLERAQQRKSTHSARRQAELSRQESQRLQERCIALRDTVRLRRAQGEKATAAEEAYNANCLGR